MRTFGHQALLAAAAGAMPTADLLLHFEEGIAAVVDSGANGITFTKSGDWTQNVTTAKWGTYGVNCSSGSGVSSSNARLAPGTGDFIYDFWLKQLNGFNIIDRCILDTKYTGGGSGAGFQLYASHTSSSADRRLTFKDNGGTLHKSSTQNVNDNTQYFVAVARIAGTIYVQLDSTVVLTFSDTTNFTNTVLCLNNEVGGSSTMNGGVDEFHYVKGWAPASMPMTVPTGAY